MSHLLGKMLTKSEAGLFTFAARENTDEYQSENQVLIDFGQNQIFWATGVLVDLKQPIFGPEFGMILIHSTKRYQKYRSVQSKLIIDLLRT